MHKFTMRHLLQLVIGLLACLAVAGALPGLFSRENITSYTYWADVKTGTIDPAPFASQFALKGLMNIIPKINDPKIKNAFYILLNVTHAIRNGEIQHFERIMEDTFEMPDAAKVLNDPFVVIFDDNGMVKNMMINKTEPGWCQNMKKSMASMLQLDLSSMRWETPMKPHAFLTKENTIYGECAVAYDVHRRMDHEENCFTVTKNMDPMSCTKFRQHEFNSMHSEECMIEGEEEMTSASRRVFEIENEGDTLLIKTLVAHGVINYFPWQAHSEAFYILANQSMEFESMMPMDSMTLPEMNMKQMMTLDDVAFQKSEASYGDGAGVDPTYGDPLINRETQMTKLQNLLEEAADYNGKENHVVMTSPEMKHGQTMIRMLDIMSRMDLPSIEIVFNNILEGTTPRDMTIKNLFLGMVPYVGTNATCLFVRNIIRKSKIADSTAVMMMSRLPNYIREPSESLLREMKDFMDLGDEISPQVKKAGILCFATMIYRTYKHDRLSPVINPLVDEFVKSYYGHMMNASDFEMALVFLQGMINIEIGGVGELLAPIIRGDIKVSNKPDDLRFHAMMVDQFVVRDYEYIHNLYYPILCDISLPLEMRTRAYTIYLGQCTRMDRLMNLYWPMVYETNEHMYNYHYTSIKGLANSANPCMTSMMEMARKLLRFMRVRPVSNIQTGLWLVDYMNKEYGFGDSMTMTTIANEHTGIPYMAMVQMTSLNRRRPVNTVTLHVKAKGIDEIIRRSIWDTDAKKVPGEKILSVLKTAGEDRPRNEPIHIEFSMMVQGRTVYTKYFDSLPTLEELTASIIAMVSTELNSQTVMFDEMYTMQVPNDLGLPSLLHNRLPVVTSVQTSNEIISHKAPIFSMRLGMIIKAWRHGGPSMTTFNPIIRSWHAIRRVSAHDMSLPMTLSISYNRETDSMKITLPRLPLTQYSISGVRSHVKSYVMVMDAEDSMLKRYCGNCRPAEMVTRGMQHRKNTTLMNYDSRDFGLRFSMHRYDCERVINPRSKYLTWSERRVEHDQNTWDNPVISSIVAFREMYLHALISPEVGTCGFLAILEPSLLYPMSQIDCSMRMYYEVPPAKTLSSFPAMKINLRITVEAKAAATDIPVHTWTMTANMGANQGLINQQIQIQITRKTPGQPDLKICMDGSKLYPTIESEPLDRAVTMKQEVIGKLTMTMGEPVNGTCSRDGMSIMMNMKGEMSDEQMEALKREMADGMCQKDMENPIYMYTESSIVPRTPACLREAMLRTVLRKYTFTILYRNILDGMMPWLDSMLMELRTSPLREFTYLPAHTEPGVMKIFMEYRLNKEMNMILRTPTHEERYMGLMSSHFLGDMSMLENTRFSQGFLEALEEKEIKFCSIYPEVLLNADGAIMPFALTQQWTLLTGDYGGYGFSVFVKRLEPKKIGVLMTVQNHTLEVIPSATIPTVTVDGKVIDYETGITIPNNETYAFRIVWSFNNRLIVQSKFTWFDMEWNERFVTLAMEASLQGMVSGLCGHLDGTHVDSMPKVYTFEE